MSELRFNLLAHTTLNIPPIKAETIAAMTAGKISNMLKAFQGSGGDLIKGQKTALR